MLFMIIPLFTTAVFRESMKSSDFIHYFLFFCYGIITSLLSFDILTSIIYVVAFIVIMLPVTLISNVKDINVSANTLSTYSLYFIIVVPFFSLLNLFIGKSYFFPFTINISVLDTIWAGLFPIALHNNTLLKKIIILISSLATAYFHDADAVYVLIIFYFLMVKLLNFNFFSRVLSFLVRDMFTKLMLVYVLAMIILNYYFPSDGILLEGLREDFRGDGIGYFKRLALIIQGYYFASENFIFGVGFGVENYIKASSGLVHNTPQILFLTMNIYAGIIGMFLMFRLIDRSLRINETLIPVEGKRTICISIVMFFLMISLHEYLFNPIVMFALIFITTFKASLELNNDN